MAKPYIFDHTITDWLKEIGKRAVGRAEIEKYYRGERLTHREAILANCYECMGGFNDGREDCLARACPLYPYSPYGSSPYPARKRQKRGPEAN